jgi:radical SAM/Cys-rich protein
MKTQILPKLTPFAAKIGKHLTKNEITVLQINLGKKCNLACQHCHVEASPKRTEELTPEVCEQLQELIARFPQLKTVDLTGGAPELNYGFKPLVETAKKYQKEVIVRSNLTIYFEKDFADIPEYCAQNEVRIVASLPCYLEDNVDQMRGKGVYGQSIKAVQWLNDLGYGKNPKLVLDLVYNPKLPTSSKFSLTPNQVKLEEDYKKFLAQEFNVQFNNLLTITNLPIGRTKFYLENSNLEQCYLSFLESNFNPQTLKNLMCRNELSIDYLGNVYDCDFNQMENLPSKMSNGERLTVAKLLEMGTLDVIKTVATAPHCYGCTAGSGSSCGGALI